MSKAAYLMGFRRVSPLNLDDRHSWLVAVTTDLATKFKVKFMRGQFEHKGDLGDVPIDSLISEMESEALDQYAYIQELKRRATLAEFQVPIHQGQLRLLVQAAEEYLTHSHLSREISRCQLENAIEAAKSVTN